VQAERNKMVILAAIVAIVVGAGIYLGPSYIIRGLARIPFRWTFNPANTLCLVVTEESSAIDEDTTSSAPDNEKKKGNVVEILHAVPGKKLDRTDADFMNWRFIPGVDSKHRGFFYQRLGVQDMGSIFYTLRWNVDKRLRFAREKGKPVEDLHAVTKVDKTRHVYFTGEMTVKIIGSDTSDRLGLIFEIDFIFERTFPARSILRLADSPAFLASMVEGIVNNETTTKPAVAYYGDGGEATKENRVALAKLIKENPDFETKVLEELGLDITSVVIRIVDMNPEDKAQLKKVALAKEQAAANMIGVRQQAAATLVAARAKRGEGKMANDVVADRFTRILKPAAENERTVAVFTSDREAAAYENNPHITTWAPGGGGTVIPIGNQK
jgi:hypothetical protein